MEMKKVLEQEGRDAKNLVAYQIGMNEGFPVSRKPPKFLTTIPAIKKVLVSTQQQTTKTNSTPRVRSASTGRDKKSELQARYWALLFGNLQRAINEIYQTVECYENMSSCQEAILVLENYIRDFKALAEWFRVSWDYETTPLPQRHTQSLAWEVRKSNPVRRVRARSLSSPTTSGKSSPCFSGKSSPSNQDENKSSPKNMKTFIDAQKCSSSKSPRVNIRNLFSSKSLKKTNEIAEDKNKMTPKDHIEPEEICLKENNQHLQSSESKITKTNLSWNEIVEMEAMSPKSDQHQEEESPKIVTENELSLEICKIDKFAQTELEDENLTLVEIREKIRKMTEEETIGKIKKTPEIIREPANETNTQKCNEIIKEPDKSPLHIDLHPKKTDSVPKLDIQQTKSSESLKKTQNSPLKYSSVLNRSSTAITNMKSTSSITRLNPRVATVKPTGIIQSISKPSISTGESVFKRAPPSKSSINNYPRNALQASRKQPLPLVRTSTNLVKSNATNPLSIRSRTMIEINNKNNKTINNLISSSKISSCEDIGSSTSTLKASNEKINNLKSNINEENKDLQHTNLDRRSEFKPFSNDLNPNNSNNITNDGWLTVKTRKRSSSHWTNRFNQPTGYASLPTLALSTEKDEQNNIINGINKKSSREKLVKQKSNIIKSDRIRTVKPAIKNAKAKVNSLPGKSYSRTKVISCTDDLGQMNTARSSTISNSRQGIMKRQKSDLTGLKMTSLHREYMRSEKLNKSINNNNNNNISSMENKTKDQVEEVDINKIDIKIQTNREFSKTIGDLYDSLAISNGVRDVDLFSCDESEEKDDTESDEDQRKLLEEQESLERQILELQNTEIDVDTETDETDCEVTIETEDIPANNNLLETSDFINDENISLETRYQSLLSEMSWGEREEALATLQAFVSRHPGRAQELHQKLSSPSRRRSLHETLKKYQAKQAGAQQKRELLQKEKALKIQQLLARVEDVKTAKQQLIDEKRLRMESRLQRATENRTQFLRDIIRKAHDEEEKLKEIVFIKNLEAQNKRLDFIESCKEQEGRLQDLEQERQKRVEEKAAKEAAVERRRQELEQARQRRLEKMNETRLEREQRIGKMQEQKEKQRQAIAREKARDREERLLALQVQQQQTTEELQRKIIQKQKESARRHEENIEHIRQRALELTIPSRNVDENGQRVDNDGDGDLSSTVSDVSKEHTRGFKKKMKKLKQRMAQNAEEYLKELQPVPTHMKHESQVPKFLNLIGKGGGAQGLERPLGQLLRLVVKAQVCDFQCFWLMDGLGVISNVIVSGMELHSETSKRAAIIAVQLYRNACSLCPQIARHAILGNSITILFYSLMQSLQTPEEKLPQYPVELSTELMLACTVALSPSNVMKQSSPKILERLPDLISYAVSTGLIEILSRRCMKIKESVENHQSVVLSLLATLGLLTKFAEICPKGPTDVTKFLGAAKSTELFSTISLLYSSVVPIGDCIPPRTTSLAAATFNLLVSMAVLDLTTFQDILSSEALSLKYLDVITILLKYCGSKCTKNGKNEIQAVIIDLIATLGFFCANNKKSQNLVTSEQYTIIIKSLTKLPEHFNMFIYPSLVTIIYKNESAKQVVARDFNVQLLDEYSKSEMGKKNRLISILNSTV